MHTIFQTHKGGIHISTKLIEYYSTLNLDYLRKFREHSEYRFVIFDAGLTCPDKTNLEEILLCGRELVFIGDGMMDDCLALAKLTFQGKTILLFVDRDYFSLVFRRNAYSDEVFRWQLAKDTRGLTLDDLELFMASFLIKSRKNTTSESAPSPEYWDGEGPNLDLLFSENHGDPDPII